MRVLTKLHGHMNVTIQQSPYLEYARPIFRCEGTKSCATAEQGVPPLCIGPHEEGPLCMVHLNITDEVQQLHASSAQQAFSPLSVEIPLDAGHQPDSCFCLNLHTPICTGIRITIVWFKHHRRRNLIARYLIANVWTVHCEVLKA